MFYVNVAANCFVVCATTQTEILTFLQQNILNNCWMYLFSVSWAMSRLNVRTSENCGEICQQKEVSPSIRDNLTE